MASTLLRDVAGVRLGNRPTAVYAHHGCCEHGVIFRDLRLAASRARLDEEEEDEERGEEPRAAPAAAAAADVRVIYRAPEAARRRCEVCGRAGGDRALCGHPDAPADPCVVCARCLSLLCGSGGGNSGSGGGWRVFRLAPARE